MTDSTLKLRPERAGNELASSFELLDGQVGERWGITIPLLPTDIDDDTAEYAQRVAYFQALEMLDGYNSDTFLGEPQSLESARYDGELEIVRHKEFLGRTSLCAQMTDYVTLDPNADLTALNNRIPYNQLGLGSQYSGNGRLRWITMFAAGQSEEVLPNAKEIKKNPEALRPAISWANDFMERVLEELTFRDQLRKSG